MAKVLATTALDMSVDGDLNFSDFLKGESATYSSSMIRVTYGNGERDTFNGSFSVNVFSKTLSGTAKEWIHSKNGHLRWQITGASISAAAVFATAKTSSLSDDKTVIENAFAGADLVVGSAFADKLMGYAGNDTVNGGLGQDTMDGGAGTHDRLDYSGQSQAVAVALNGSTWVWTKLDGIDEDLVRNFEDVAGGSGADSLTGDALANALSGNGGDDTVAGGSGNDTVTGGAGADSLLGGSGADSLDGGADADYLAGGSGNDVIVGGTGADILVGGAGRDSMTGGADADIFRFLSSGDSPNTTTGRDFIIDFVHLVDKIDLSAIDAVATIAGDQAFVLDAKGTATKAVAQGHIGWYQVNASGTANDRTYLRINTDADATIEMNIELKGLVSLGAVDFIL